MVYVNYYLTMMKIAIIEQFQYRVAYYFYTFGMIAEPLIYLVVWTTIANAGGGVAGGMLAGAFAAYYIVWTLVRTMNISFTPFGWEDRIRMGQLTSMLLKPIHPIHSDLAFFGGEKIPNIIMWLPIAVVLSLIFHPIFSPSALGIIVFFISIWLAFIIRTIALWLLGMITFWTTRVSAIFDLYFALELILSGRLVPLSLLPQWTQNISLFLPFQWTFNFPIETIAGNYSISQLLFGLGMQIVWIAAGSVALQFFWKRAIQQFTSVGN